MSYHALCMVMVLSDKLFVILHVLVQVVKLVYCHECTFYLLLKKKYITDAWTDNFKRYFIEF